MSTSQETTAFIVRPATSADVEGIQRVGLATWPHTYVALAGAQYVIDGLARWWSRDAVLRSCERHATWVAIDRAGSVVGVAVAGEADAVAWLWKLYVLPALHGQGIGAALMSAAIRWAGRRPLHLAYVSGNARAAGFYHGWGFRPVSGHGEDRGQGAAPEIHVVRAAQPNGEFDKRDA